MSHDDASSPPELGDTDDAEPAQDPAAETNALPATTADYEQMLRASMG